MKFFHRLLPIATILIPFSSIQAQAAGFALYESSARGDGMGGTLIARADSPSALIYNPAGITQLEGTQIELGTAIIPPRGTVTITEKDTKVKGDNHIVPYAYATHQVTDQLWLGLSLGTRFGLGTEWDTSWLGRYSSTEVNVLTLSFQPTIAYQINEKLSVAVSAEIMYGDVTLSRQVPLSKDVNYELNGDAFGLGAVAALHYRPNDQWRLGLTARTPVKLDLEGKATLAGIEYDAESDLSLPGSLSMGAAYQITSNLSLEADLIYTFWKSYDELKVIANGLPTSIEVKDWKNTFRFQFGAEYAVNENWDIRAGYVWDQSPMDEHVDFLAFPGDRQIFSLGLGYKTESWNIDVAYAYLFGKDEIHDMPYFGQVEYKDSTAHIFNVNFGFKF